MAYDDNRHDGALTHSGADLMDVLLDAEGYEETLDGLEELWEDRGADSLVPAVCKFPECGYVADYEPDQTMGWCKECGTATCISFLSLWGIL